jgi:protease YdgD
VSRSATVSPQSAPRVTGNRQGIGVAATGVSGWVARVGRAAVLALAAVWPAAAEQPAHRGLVTGDEVRGWQAVGKLVLGERGFCTATLIAPDLVLTAAHCLYDRETGARTPDALISFQAGLRNGRAEAYRAVARAVAHPDFIYSGAEDVDRVAVDLALVQLDRPIRLPQLLPFATDARPESGDRVSVVSYAQDRADVPSIEEDCAVLSTAREALVLTCDIDFGSSGAPVFTVTDGVARVVSVISAKAEYEGGKVALAVPLEAPLADLMEALAKGAARHRGAPGVRVLSGGSGGAKFIAP